MTTYTHMLDRAQEAEPPADGILSRTIFQDDKIKAVVFGFGQGQELSEHTAAKPAMLFFVKGQATVGLLK
jgi:quercetin dioxygenase-like cupin family protein